MACPKCGCKVHYQFCDGDLYACADEDRERCAACGHLFYSEDSTEEDEDEPADGVKASDGYCADCEDVRHCGTIKKCLYGARNTVGGSNGR